MRLARITISFYCLFYGWFGRASKRWLPAFRGTGLPGVPRPLPLSRCCPRARSLNASVGASTASPDLLGEDWRRRRVRHGYSDAAKLAKSFLDRFRMGTFSGTILRVLSLRCLAFQGTDPISRAILSFFS